MKQRLIKILCFVFTLIFICGVIPFSAFAAKISNPMDNTYVVDDLNKMGVNLKNYPKDPSATFVSVMYFQEYGFDANGDQRFYGLYVYLYNPSGKQVSLDGNYLQMAYIDAKGEVTKYVKYALTCKSVSVDQSDSCLFYKFKVEATSGIGREIPKGCREYRLSGIELKDAATGKTKDYALDQTWIYTGHQLNFGKKETDRDSLYVTRKVLETIPIELRSASWFSKTSDLGEDYRYEVSSVYFNIPNYFINEYGDPFNRASKTHGLYAVRGEYYKYVTNGLLVPDQTWYNKFYDMVGNDLRLDSNYANGYVGSYPGFYDVYHTSLDETGEIDTTYSCSYNMGVNLYTGQHYTSSKKMIPSFQNLAVSANGVLSKDGFEAVYNQFGKGKFTDGSNLVLGDKIQTGNNYTEYYISVDDAVLNSQIKSFASSQKANWLHKLFNKELYVDEDGYDDIEPIVEVSEFQLDLSDLDILAKEALAEKYFVSVDDLASLSEFCDKYDSNSHVYLMRFDVNPYYCPSVVVTDKNVYGDVPLGTSAYYFEKAVFENFDVLEFTFKNAEGKPSTVPVVCDPIDILGFVVPGNNTIEDDPNNPGGEDKDDGFNLWQWLKNLWSMLGDTGKLIAVVVVIIIVLLLWKFFGKFILAIFKGIGALFGGIGRAVSGANRVYEHKADRHTDKVERERRHVREDADERRRDADERRRDADELRKDADERRKDRKEREDRKESKWRRDHEERKLHNDERDRSWRRDHESKKMEIDTRDKHARRRLDEGKLNLKINEDTRRQENHDYIKSKREEKK